ncbi:MAG: hypothetical protein V8T10_01550 [Merdibacter sp.]
MFFHEIAIVQTLLFQPLRTLYALLYVLVLPAVHACRASRPLLVADGRIAGAAVRVYAQTWVLSYYPSVLWILCWICALAHPLAEASKARCGAVHARVPSVRSKGIWTRSLKS